MASVMTIPAAGSSEQAIDGDRAAERGLLERNRLFALLDAAVTKRLTVVSAPPGSGKTSLLRRWADRSADDRRVAFVAVERDEENVERFWSTVLAEVGNGYRHAAGEVRGAAATAPDSEDLVAQVASAISEQAEPVVLVIDDLHELKGVEALVGLERLLERVPRSAAVVLSARRDPQIRLHRFRLADEIAEIRASDLRFTEGETLELLAASQIELSDSGARTLHARTEGWAAGLRLAVIALRTHRDPERFVAEFSGTDRAIGEYLMAEMLDRQPVVVQRMLLRTSLVDRVNGELADLLAERSGSEQMLLELEEANAFVASLDAQRTCFRYHQLLTDFLRLELRRTSADEIPDLHRRAASWLMDRGDVVEAVRHTVEAGDWPVAAHLVADHSFRWVLDGDRGTIDTVLEAFPEGASAEHPDLALAHAARALNRGALEEAGGHLEVAESGLGDAPPLRRRRLSVAIASLRLAIARRSGQFSEVIELANRLDSSVSSPASDQLASDVELRAVALLSLGIAETLSGRFAEAERHLLAGAAVAQTLDWPYLEVACRAHLGFPSQSASFATVRMRGQQAIELAERHRLADHPILAPAFGAVAGATIWMGEFEEGERWLRRAWNVAAPYVDPAAAVLLHTVTGMLHAGRGDHHSALGALSAAAQMEAQLTGVHALAPLIAGWLAETQARIGRPNEARASLERFSGDEAQMAPIHNAYAAISIVEDDPEAALQVLGAVTDARPIVAPAYTLVETHLLAGIAHFSQGDRRPAAAAAEAALAAAEADRVMLPFAMTDAGELLETVPRHETAHTALLADIVDLLRGTSVPTTATESATVVEELSPRELRVLRYLPTNMTRSEIACELYVSVNTVNTHVRNIYAKLGTGDRSAAVRRARQLRLLSAGRTAALPR